MTVFDNVAFPLQVRRVRKPEVVRRVGEVLELVELSAQTRHYPHELSGGQQQRIALARALVYSAAVLLLDEPFSNLDAKLRERTRAWFRALQRSLALTTIFVTHDQHEALGMSDRVLVMDHGIAQQTGTLEDIYRRPSNRFVADFVGHSNFTVGTAITIAVRPEAIELGEPEPATTSEANRCDVELRSVAFLGDTTSTNSASDRLSCLRKPPHPSRAGAWPCTSRRRRAPCSNGAHVSQGDQTTNHTARRRPENRMTPTRTSTVREVRVLVPTGMLGAGFSPETVDRGMSLGADVIAVDGGSTDSGPYYLGTATAKTAEQAVGRDLRILLTRARRADVPLTRRRPRQPPTGPISCSARDSAPGSADRSNSSRRSPARPTRPRLRP